MGGFLWAPVTRDKALWPYLQPTCDPMPLGYKSPLSGPIPFTDSMDPHTLWWNQGLNVWHEPPPGRNTGPHHHPQPLASTTPIPNLSIPAVIVALWASMATNSANNCLVLILNPRNVVQTHTRGLVERVYKVPNKEKQAMTKR